MTVIRVFTDLENREKVREFCYRIPKEFLILKNGLGLTVELNLGLEMSGKCQGISYCLESRNPVSFVLRCCYKRSFRLCLWKITAVRTDTDRIHPGTGWPELC